jgi:hypothetical protein
MQHISTFFIVGRSAVRQKDFGKGRQWRYYLNIHITVFHYGAIIKAGETATINRNDIQKMYYKETN